MGLDEYDNVTLSCFLCPQYRNGYNRSDVHAVVGLLKLTGILLLNRPKEAKSRYSQGPYNRLEIMVA